MRGVRSIAILVLAAVGVACSWVVDTDGLSGGAVAQEAGSPVDTGVDAPDASVADVDDACPTQFVEQSFETSFAPFVLNANEAAAGYPKLETLDGRPAAVLLTVGSGRVNAYAQAYYPKRLPFASFSVSFDARLLCVEGDPSTCADALEFMWVDADDVRVLGNSVAGGAGGAPARTAGAGVVLDLYQNGDLGEQTAHGIEIVKLDPTRDLVAGYPWAVTATLVDLSTKWRTIQIDRHGTRVDVKLDGVESVGADIESPTTGIFGFGASTGGLVASFGVRNFKGTFSSCP